MVKKSSKHHLDHIWVYRVAQKASHYQIIKEIVY